MAEINDLNGNVIQVSSCPEPPKQKLEECFFCEEPSEPYQMKEVIEHNGRAVIFYGHFSEHLCETDQWQALNKIMEKKANA